jgi:hypothetical protein
VPQPLLLSLAAAELEGMPSNPGRSPSMQPLLYKPGSGPYICLTVQSLAREMIVFQMKTAFKNGMKVFRSTDHT